jgi:excisionase family DNA binding protein
MTARSQPIIDSVSAVGRLTFSLAEAAKMIGVSERLLNYEVSRGRLRVVRVGRRVLIPRAEMLRLLGLD